MNDGDREQIIRTAIKSAQAKGITLSKQTWGIVWHDKKGWIQNKSNCCCAIGCVILELQDTIKRKLDWRQWTAETILDCDCEWVRSFQRGFDGQPKTELDANSFSYDLGMLICEELVGKNEQPNLPGM
jgi:hypothetical protein